MSCFAPVYWTVSFRPQRRQRSSPASSAEPCFGAPWAVGPRAFLLTICRIASARSQSTYPSCVPGFNASHSVAALRRARTLAPEPS